MSLEPHYAGVSPEFLPQLNRNPIHVVLDNIRSAFNVGSAFRTSDAACVDHLHLCGLCAHPPNPKLEKTALGAFDYVPWTYYEKVDQAVERLVSLEIPLVAVENTPDAQIYTQFDWPRPVAVVFGHEVEGISPTVLARCSHRVIIPVLGFKRTLNVATAFGIVLYEVLRQWNPGGFEQAQKSPSDES